MALFGAKKKQAFGQIPQQVSPLQAYGSGEFAPAQQMQQQPAKFMPNLLGVLGDAAQVFAGGQATYMQGIREQQDRDQMMRQRQMEQQQQRETGWQDYVRKQEYERANPSTPQPTEFERILQASGLPQEQQIQLMQDFARNRANPLQGVPFTDAQGNSGLQFIRPGQMQPQNLVPIGGTLPPKGGPASQSPGNFRP